MIKNIISKKATYSAFFNTESTRYDRYNNLPIKYDNLTYFDGLVKYCVMIMYGKL